jgi:hypothetical protein
VKRDDGSLLVDGAVPIRDVAGLLALREPSVFDRRQNRGGKMRKANSERTGTCGKACRGKMKPERGAYETPLQPL